GVTMTERMADPELYVTPDRLKSMTLTELSALDPLLIPSEMLDGYLTRFIANKDFEHCADVLEKRGYTAEVEKLWESVIRDAGIYGQSEVALRLINLRKEVGLTDEDLHPSF